MQNFMPEMNNIGAVAAIILGFGFLIFVHELGHFLVAKWVGIKVEQFAIGFGHSILAWRKGLGFKVGTTEPELQKRIVKHLVASNEIQTQEGQEPQLTEAQIEKATAELGLGETEYRFNWMPLGGYVKMLGQDDMDPTSQSDNPRSFNRKAPWARACVISAGVAMNLIFGVLFFIVAFMAGVAFPPPIVSHTMPGMPAATTYAQGHDGDNQYLGIQTGDVITHIDGDPVTDMLDVRVATALARAGQEFDFTVKRESLDETLTFKMTPVQDPGDKLLSVGIRPNYTLSTSAIVENSPEAEAGVSAGMTITAVDGKPVKTYAQYVRALTAKQGLPATVTFTDERNGTTLDVQHEAIAGLVYGDSNQPNHLAGLIPATRIEFVNPGSPSEKAGILAGDIITQIGDHAWPAYTQIREIVTEAGSKPLKVSVWRDGETVELAAVTPHRGKIGVVLVPAMENTIVSQTIEGSPLAILSLPPGSSITAINNQSVSTWADMQRILQGLSAAEAVTMVDWQYQLNIAGQPTEQATIPFKAETVNAIQYARWAPPTTLQLQMQRDLVQASNPLVALGLGLDKTKQLMIQTYVIIGRLFSGTVKVEHLRGPVGIVDEGTRIAKQGPTYLLFFLGVISINLVVINFLPLPIVDGGLMVFLIIEKIKGSPVSPKVLGMANIVGLVLIASLALVLTYHDIARLIMG